MMTKGAEARGAVESSARRACCAECHPQARLRIDRLNFGPPVGFPVQFRVPRPGRRHRPYGRRQGPYSHARQPEHSRRAVRLERAEEVDPARGSSSGSRTVSGATQQDISQTLGTLLSGYTVTEYKEGIELVPVVARAIPEERLGLGSFEDLTIPTRSGAAVPISQVARVHYEFEEPILWRRNRDVVLTVRSTSRPACRRRT